MEKYPIKTFRNVEVMQEVERGFTLQFVNDICAEWSSLKDYAYILHDKDDTRPHIHLMLRFHKPVPTSAIINKFGGVIEFQHLNKCYAWNSAIAYLTHRNRPNKHQYTDDCVFSNYDWKKDAQDALNSDKSKLEALAEKIASGECRQYNYTNYITDVFYSSYKRKIDALFQYKYDALALENKGDRNMELMYIYGGSGTGKTTFAKFMCNKLGMSYYVSSGGKNPLDNYGGQDVIILDDLRPSDYKFNEFLKLTDNHTSSMVSCRYYNKSLVWCKLMIITSTLKISDFYANMQESDGEQAKQLKRRFGEVYIVDKDKISSYVWDDDLEMHTWSATVDNDLLGLFRKNADERKQKNINRLNNIGLKVSKTAFDKAVNEIEKLGFVVDDSLPDDVPF